MSQHFRAKPGDSFFPKRLCHDPEICHYVEAEGPLSGALDRLSPAVAIVGTRNPPDAAARYTRWFASELARVGVVIVSGGAYGIDAAAHEGALDVGGRTIAVVPAGLDTTYPRVHGDLFARILERGALVAVKPRGTDIKKHFFDDRNAVIAALADHVVVTCCPFKSGARSTMRHARLLPRPLWIVPGAPWDVLTEAQARECALGSATRIISPQPLVKAFALHGKVEGSFLRPSPDDDDVRIEPVLGPKPLFPRPSRASKRAAAPRSVDPASISPAPRRTLETCESILPSADERNVVEALREGPLGIDELVLRTGLGVAPLRGLLLTWTVEGVVREGPAGLFRLANH